MDFKDWLTMAVAVLLIVVPGIVGYLIRCAVIFYSINQQQETDAQEHKKIVQRLDKGDTDFRDLNRVIQHMDRRVCSEIAALKEQAAATRTDVSWIKKHLQEVKDRRS